jgi:hypothetical protein
MAIRRQRRWNSPPSYLSALDGRRGFSHFDDPDAQRTETEAYYAGIGIDFSGGGPSVLDALASLDAFRKRYFTADPTEYITRYYNRGDLGIGREMHCVFGGERACYVSNYGPIDANGNPIFGDREQSSTALQQGQPFATGAMLPRVI